jgi:hypothetical protein
MAAVDRGVTTEVEVVRIPVVIVKSVLVLGIPTVNDAVVLIESSVMF